MIATLVVIGTSENVEAEYGSSSGEPFTLLIIEDGIEIAIEGYNTKNDVVAALSDCHECSVERLF